MSKSMYRGHEVVANDNAKAKVVTRDAVYRGAKYDPTEKASGKAATRKTRVTYRGAKAA